MDDFKVKFIATVKTVQNGVTLRNSKTLILNPRSGRNWERMIWKSAKETGKFLIEKILKEKYWPNRATEGLVEDEETKVCLCVDGECKVFNDEMMSRSMVDFVQYFRAMRPHEKEMVLRITMQINFV